MSLARHHHSHPQSPFGRAGDPTHDFEFDFNTNLSPPSRQNGTRPRHNYRTGTLAGAYRAVSRTTSMSDEGAHLASTPSPRHAHAWNHVDNLSPTSNHSNPPGEFADDYNRIGEDGTLANYAQWDNDPEFLSGKGTKLASGRLSRSSSRQRQQEYDGGSHEGREFLEAGLLDGIIQNSPKRTADYSRDEQRLRHVTSKDSPIFSKAKTSSRSALTADNLQRREDEEQPWRKDNHHHHQQEQQSASDYEGDGGPSLNLPRTWGSRASRRQEWRRNISGSSGSEKPENWSHDGPDEVSISAKVDAKRNPIPKLDGSSLHTEQASAPARGALEERVASLRTQTIQDTQDQTGLGLDQNTSPADGAAIPNTPIVVYKNSTLGRPNTTKRDSQELLRRLSRTESPKLDQIQTPDPPKLFERKVYDKTPRVTGAWIDTPMTERAVDIPSELTKDLVTAAPPKAKVESIPEPQPAASVKPEIEQKDPNKNETENVSAEPNIAKRSKRRPPLARPKLPKSALETVIEDVNSGKEALNVGDDTIESLQAILDDPTDLKAEEDDETAYEQVLDRLGLGRRNGEGPDEYDRIDSKLQSLAQHITEVKKGLDRLQGHVTTGFGDMDSKKDAINAQPTSIPTSKESCQACSMHSDTRVYAAVPLPQLWQRNHTSHRIRITKLGWFTLALVTWYIIECIMAHIYFNACMDPNCLQSHVPVFPFVTVTMLWRWSHLSSLFAPILTIGMAFFRLIAQLLGLSDGFMEEPMIRSGLIGEIRINGTPVAFPWLVPVPKTQVFSPPSDVPPSPPSPEWIPYHEAPTKAEDDQVSMDDDEYL